MHYYNEHDTKAASWLRELIKGGHIPEGIVDERSICDLKPKDLRGFTQCHFFAGIGGWALALQLAAWPEDKKVWTASCPCQPYSSAGKRLGNKDPRNLWPVFFKLARQCRPDVMFGEQIESAIRFGWLDGISADLEGAGYACGAVVLGAHSAGAPQIRGRLYWGAQALGKEAAGKLADTAGTGGAVRREEPQHAGQPSFWSVFKRHTCADGETRRVEPGTLPVADGVPAIVGRLRGYGNAIVPQAAAEFIKAFSLS